MILEQGVNSEILFQCGDALSELRRYSGPKFQLVVTSPPYNIGKSYETKRALDEYLEEQSEIIEQLVDLVDDQGSICWQVGNTIDEKTREIFPLDIYFYPIFRKLGMKLRNRIIWQFGHGLHASSRFSGRYETVLWFTKSDNYLFKLDDVRVKSKYPGKRHYKGPNKGELSGNPLGKNPSDIWLDIALQDWEKEIWSIPNVKANHVEKTTHPCQYPVELVKRCILALSNEQDWILDPFAGVGSTLLAAAMTNRNALGIEMHQSYIDIAQERLIALNQGELLYRPIGKPIYDHTKSKLSEVPAEYK